MMASYDDYSNIITSFYHKLIKTHKNKHRLLEKFNKLSQQITKRNECVSPQMKNKKKGDQTGSISGRSNRSYRTVKQVTLKSINAEYLYLNKSFRKVFCYAFLHALIQKNNQQVFLMIESKVKLLLNTKQKLPSQQKNQIEKSNHEWRKIVQLLSHKQKVRWQKILGDSLSRISEQFINILVKSILNRGQHGTTQIQPSETQLKKMSNELKFTIIFLEYQNKKLINRIDSGIYNQKLIIGYLKSDNQFALFDKIPKQGSQGQIQLQVNSPGERSKTSNQRSQFYLSINQRKQKYKDQNHKSASSIGSNNNRDDKSIKVNTRTNNLLRKKTQRIVQNILKQYTLDNDKIFELNVLKDRQLSKDAQIRKKYESRKKI